MKFFLLLSLFITFASGCLNGQDQNMLINGTFNGNPSFIGWKTETVELVHQADGGKEGGCVWLNHDGGDTDPEVTQTVNGFVPGNTYIISGVYRGGSQADVFCECPGTHVFAVDLDGQELKTYPMPEPFDTWSKFNISFTATAESHTLRLRGEINGTDGDVVIDNISIRPEVADWFRLKTMFRGDSERPGGQRPKRTEKDSTTTGGR